MEILEFNTLNGSDSHRSYDNDSEIWSQQLGSEEHIVHFSYANAELGYWVFGFPLSALSEHLLAIRMSTKHISLLLCMFHRLFISPPELLNNRNFHMYISPVVPLSLYLDVHGFINRPLAYTGSTKRLSLTGSFTTFGILLKISTISS